MAKNTPAAASGSPAGSGGEPAAASIEPAPESFEQALGELEELVRRMEEGELSLEGSLAAYRRGAGLVGFCRRSLADVQQQVKLLEGDLLRPFETQDTDPA